MMNRVLPAVLCAALLPTVVRADWGRWSEGDGSVYLNAVSAPDRDHVFVAGDSIDTSGSLPSLHPRVYASSDRGRTFTEISGNLHNLSGFSSATAVAFVDAQTGWVAVGNNIYRTTNGGTNWQATNVSQGTTALKSFDSMNLARVGKNSSASISTNGGQAWTPSSGLDFGYTFVAMFWLDRQRGWATANVVDENGIATQAELFRTTDGGNTWTETWSHSNMGAGPVFFLADGQTGWVATYVQTNTSSDPPDPYAGKAHLFKTTNGGDDLSDINLPTSVGTVSGLFGSSSIDLTRIYAMHWDDAQHGHLVGGAFLGSSTSGSSGGMTSTSQTKTSWRVVDYPTDDGTTWDHRTQLGQITATTALPPSDGAFTTGLMLDRENGWIVADRQAVWGYESTCDSKAACPVGYTCTDHHCVSDSPTSNGTDGGSSTAGGGGSLDLGGKSNDRVRAGCQCGNTSPTALLLLLPLWLARRKRSRAL